MLAVTETLSLFVYEPTAKQNLAGGPSPKFGERVELEGRVWYPVRSHHTEHNLLIETDTLSLPLEPISLAIFGVGGRDPQIGGRGGARG